MAARVTSELFVGALVRNVRAVGGFAYIARRGNAQAGAVHLAVFRSGTGGYDLYQPVGMQMLDDPQAPTDRVFGSPRAIAGEQELRAFIASETRFDSDFWLVEIENLSQPLDTLVTIVPE